MPDQNLIDDTLAPQQGPSNLIDSAVSPQAEPNLIDRVTAAAPQAPSAPGLAVGATSIGPYQQTFKDRLFAMLGSKAPQGSFMANATGQLGTKGTPQLIAPEAAMAPLEQFQHPVATGILKTAGGITTPTNVLMIAGSGGLGALPGAAGKLVPALVGGGFSASMIKGIYDRVPDLKNQVSAYNAAVQSGDTNRADTLASGIKQTIAEMATSGVFATLAATGAVRGARAKAAIPESTGPGEAVTTTGQEATEPAVQTAIAPASDHATTAAAAAKTAGVPPAVAARIAQNAEALRPIVDPEKIETRADVGKQLDQAADVLQKNPDPRMSQPLTFREQQRLANELGMKPADLLASKPGQAFSAEQVVAANSMLEASRTAVMNAARLAATGDEAAGQSFLETIARHQEIQQTVTERVAAEAGRALGAFRNAPKEGTIQSAVDALSKLDDAARLEAANRLAKLDPNDTAAVAKFTREITPSSTADKLYEAWMNGILSGGTTIVKGASDVAMRTLGIATRAVSPAVDFIRFALTGEPRERFFGEAPADLYGLTRGASRALAQFSDTFFHEKGMGEGPLDTGTRTAAIKGPLGTVVRTPTRALEAVTDAAKIVNYSADIHAQAYRQAMSEGLSGDAAWQRMEQLASDPTPEMRTAAGQYGKEQTFQQKLGPIGKGIMDLRNKVPGGKYILPFIKTPANILNAAIDYSPAGVIKTGIKAAQGKLAGGALSDMLAKNSLGTALAGATVYHALQGNITGSGPASSNDRLRLEQQGWQPYSVKVGNRFVSYRKLEPIGTVMGMAADVADAVKESGPASGPASGNFTKRLVSKIKNNLGNAEFIGSLMRLNQIFESPEKYARGMAGTVIPTAVANVAKATDRTVRTPDTNAPFPEQIKQQLESRIPGLTQNVPALTAPNRQPIERPATAVGGFNPYPATTATPGLPAAQRQIEIEQRRRQQLEARKQLIRQQLKARQGR